jgi:hypothetical protein
MAEKEIEVPEQFHPDTRPLEDWLKRWRGALKKLWWDEYGD